MRLSRVFARRFFFSSKGSQRHDLDPLLLLKDEKPLLQIEVIGARELFKKGLSLDPYCKVKVGTTVYTTSVAKRTSDPVFGETFVFDFCDDDKLELEVWDQETFSSDVLVGTAETTIEQIRKGQALAAEVPGTHGKGVETFFHLVAPEVAAVASSTAPAKPVSWVQDVLEKSSKAGREAVGGVASTWLSFLSKDLQEKIKSSAVQTQGRLYIRFKIAPASSLGTVLPQVVPPAKIDPALVRSKPKSLCAEWDTGLKPPDR